MKSLKSIYFTVTNDLVFDQRMERICTSLSNHGYRVTLVGRRYRNSPVLASKKYNNIRLKCWYSKGKLFYIEFNIRLWWFLIFRKMDAVCAIDLDTILPVLAISKLKGIPRIYDAHELFCEMKEVVTRPAIYRIWKGIEKWSLPQFMLGYTVCEPIAEEFKHMYGKNFEVIRNVPLLEEGAFSKPSGKFILYQGAVNEGRSFETLIPAMTLVNAPLVICGDGNFMVQAKKTVEQLGLSQKVIFKGMISPEELRQFTRQAAVGITLFDKTGKSNYLSLANRFFDYIHACLPQVCVGYPAYAQINDQVEIALLIDDLSPRTIAGVLNNLLNNDVVYHRLQENCLRAREIFNWQQEEQKLLRFYEKIFD